MGRKQVIPPGTRLVLSGLEPRSRLQSDSLRRAIINRVVETGGVTTIEDLDAHFTIETRAAVTGLIRKGWLRVAT